MIKSHYSFAQRSYERAIKLYNRLQEDEITMIQKNPGYQMYFSFKTNLIDTFPMEAIENPNSYHAWLYLLRASQLGLGIFQSNANDGQAFPFFYDDEYLEVVGKKNPENAEHPVWLLALYAAIIVRNQEAIDFLTTIDNEVFVNSNYGNQLKPFDYALADLLKGLFAPSADLAHLLEQAYITSNPDDYPIDEAYLYASRLKWPLVSVIEAIFTENGEQAYNSTMEKALLLHQEYYSDEERMWNDRGAISIPLTAMAVIAKEVKGYQLSVENEYIPDWLINVNPPKPE
ncbi:MULTISPECIES: immunity 49 family protein [unclassified Pseudoalteromonas]|uniref:immunity 49 family protein n=1 Tax=unclassified Pseudoalteromonas TaxID=194690 RepID=UPI0016025284|nr:MULTISPECIES: immunity 49 family protein [unclassified Pseudoalteromonas]MBB1335988.1 immunity 49 family protein [Pseudoalteromonas sp. SR41-6]MBB1436926.1 immunity 49 family protein [Pseudoalteromonas sp. SG43-6]MBB1461555.1 immunity 49 family protein [Pseudoalteromonas sp. SG41-8]